MLIIITKANNQQQVRNYLITKTFFYKNSSNKANYQNKKKVQIEKNNYKGNVFIKKIYFNNFQKYYNKILYY